MRLTLVISSLSSGGAERVMSIMANYWAEKRWRICLLTFEQENERPFYDLHPDIQRTPLGLRAASRTPIQAAARMAEAPDWG